MSQQPQVPPGCAPDVNVMPKRCYRLCLFPPRLASTVCPRMTGLWCFWEVSLPVTRETGVQLPCGRAPPTWNLPWECGALWTSSRTSQSGIPFLCIQKFSSSCLGVRTFLSVSNCLSCTSYERTVVLRKHTTLALTCPGGIVFGHFGCARM